jgi:D-alanyl-D-alanine carboxypeptidase (penicillin-binding protein 5/6)
LTRLIMQDPLFANIVQYPTYTLAATSTHGAITMDNTNDLLTGAADLGVDGVKTGSTLAAGQCVVVDANHNGYHIILVVLGEQNADDRLADSTSLLQWAYGQLPAKGGTPTPTTTKIPSP